MRIALFFGLLQSSQALSQESQEVDSNPDPDPQSQTQETSSHTTTQQTLDSVQSASQAHTPEAEADFLERYAKQTEATESESSENAQDPENEVSHKALRIKGCGIWLNRMLKKSVWITLPPKGRRPERLKADFVEDSVSILKAELESMGYLKFQVDLEIEFADESIQTHKSIQAGRFQVSDSQPIERVTFEVHKGNQFYYKEIHFLGLTAMDQDTGEGYFRGPEFLIRLKSNRIYSPERFKQGMANLEEGLRQLGYREAQVLEDNIQTDTETGQVKVTVKVVEGPLYLVRTTRHTVKRENAPEPEVEQQFYEDTPFSESWVMDWMQKLRERQYVQGFAEAETRIVNSATTPATKEVDPDQPQAEKQKVFVDLEAATEPGAMLFQGETKIIGSKKTSEKFLRRKVNLQPGDPLNPLEIQEARYRLARTGLFDSVRYTFEEPLEETFPPTRDISFHLQESKTTEVNLLAGYGSFELLRGGVEWEQKNLFGIGHQSRLRLVQAIRASRINYDYSAPGLFHSSMDGFFSLFARQRNEAAFIRQESGGGVGTEFPLEKIQSRMGIRYNLEYLNAKEIETQSPLGSPNSRVGSVSVNLLHDKRDQILAPQKGYHVFAHVESAARYLGGDSVYQRIEVGGSWRRELYDGGFLHLGLAHGLILAPEDRARLLPFNKRFFPGGENSIRGYQVSEASPVDGQGSRIGAESFWLTQVELEQALTPSWSVVTFQDTLGIATDYNDYPSTETLYTLGLGIRWKTIVGPVRLEYGHNLNPRDRDPKGTVLFSIGSPF